MLLIIIFKEYLTRFSFNIDARFRMFRGAIKPITTGAEPSGGISNSKWFSSLVLTLDHRRVCFSNVM
jgi:hypothetical protein